MEESVRWRCETISCLRGDLWWVSTAGVIQCLNCRPPALAGLVVALGHVALAPEVDSDASNVVRGWQRPDPVDYGAMGPPLWILRRRTPEQVEAKEGRRNVDLPADATRMCREGDLRWEPIPVVPIEAGRNGEAP